MLKMETTNSYNHHNMDLPSDQFASLPIITTNTTAAGGVDHDVDQKTSLGFMELLGFQDYYYYSDNTTTYHQELPPPPSGDHHLKQNDINGDEESSVVLNGQPPSPNSSSITSLAHQPLQNNIIPLQQCINEKKAMGGDETKAKKKKKEKAPRFAFMTRTEIDHLDDGYRWRKYGQKAVKNSRFPRSYYRCTSASCNVKKRVERCMGDPSFVITTYEGQHNHPVTPNNAPILPSFNHFITSAAFTATTATTPNAMRKLDQGGLLQDMLPCYH